MEFTQELVLQVLQAVLTVAVPVATAFLVALINKNIQNAKAQLSAENYAMAKNIIFDLVQSAEAHGLTGKIGAAGADKFAYVVQRAEDELAKNGIDFDLDQVADLIESAWLELSGAGWEAIESELES